MCKYWTLDLRTITAPLYSTAVMTETQEQQVYQLLNGHYNCTRWATLAKYRSFITCDWLLTTYDDILWFLFCYNVLYLLVSFQWICFQGIFCGGVSKIELWPLLQDSLSFTTSNTKWLSPLCWEYMAQESLQKLII